MTAFSAASESMYDRMTGIFSFPPISGPWQVLASWVFRANMWEIWQVGHWMVAFFLISKDKFISNENLLCFGAWQVTAWQLFLGFFKILFMIGYSMIAIFMIFKVLPMTGQHDSFFSFIRISVWQDDRYFQFPTYSRPWQVLALCVFRAIMWEVWQVGYWMVFFF